MSRQQEILLRLIEVLEEHINAVRVAGFRALMRSNDQYLGRENINVIVPGGSHQGRLVRGESTRANYFLSCTICRKSSLSADIPVRVQQNKKDGRPCPCTPISVGRCNCSRFAHQRRAKRGSLAWGYSSLITDIARRDICNCIVAAASAK